MDRKWCVRDLFVDHQTGKLRETAVWSNVGKASMTMAFIWAIFHGQQSEWLWISYGGIIVSHEATARFFNQRQQEIDKGKT